MTINLNKLHHTQFHWDGEVFYYKDNPFTGVCILFKFTYYYKNGLCHRENGPAVIYSDGTQKYYINNKLHREDGPAIIYPNGKKEYYSYGKKLNIILIINYSKKFFKFI